MEAARDLVDAAAELAAGVERGEHGLDAREAGLLVLVDRDAAAVVLHGNTAVGVDDDVDAVAETGHSLVDGVVDDLVDEVVEAALVGGADVHAGPAADGLEPLEDLDLLGGVGRTRGAVAGVLAPAVFRLAVGRETVATGGGLALAAALGLGPGHVPSLGALAWLPRDAPASRGSGRAARLRRWPGHACTASARHQHRVVPATDAGRPPAVSVLGECSTGDGLAARRRPGRRPAPDFPLPFYTTTDRATAGARCRRGGRCEALRAGCRRPGSHNMARWTRKQP